MGSQMGVSSGNKRDALSVILDTCGIAVALVQDIKESLI
jgi:hypothetical protein